MTAPDPWVIWAVALGAGLIGVAMRLSFIELFAQREMPEWLRRALRFVAPAVLTAMIAPAVLLEPDGSLAGVANPRLAAALVAVLAALHSRSLIWPIVGGMATLWGLQALGGA